MGSLLPTWVVEWAPVAPWLVALAIGVLVVVKLWPLLRKLGHFLDDVAGEPARPGVPARPGLMERIATVEHELTTNSGSSVKDAVKRIEDTQRAQAAQLADLHQKYGPKETTSS